MGLFNKLLLRIDTRQRLTFWQRYVRFWPLIALGMVAMWVVRIGPSIGDSPLDSGLPDLASVQQLAYSEDKLCLLYFATSYCYPCSQSEAMFQKDRALQEVLRTGYVPFTIDPMGDEKGAELAHMYGIDSLPAFVITSAEGEIIRKFSSLADPYQLTNHLERAYFLQEVPAPIQTSQAEIPPLGQQASRYPAASERVYGLAYPDSGNRQTLLSQARIISQEWNQGVWIQAGPKEDQSVVVIGAFTSEEEALATQAVLRSWQRKETELCTLYPRPIPLQELKDGSTLPGSETEKTQP